MRTLAFPLAVVLLAALSVAAVALASGLWRWVTWVLGAGGTAGLVGLAVTGAAAVNLVVPRTCARTELPGGAVVRDVNRPVVSLVLDTGDCFEHAAAQLQVAVLAGLVTSLAVVRRDRRPDPVGGAAVG